jgi:hypothetical protein
MHSILRITSVILIAIFLCSCRNGDRVSVSNFTIGLSGENSSNPDTTFLKVDLNDAVLNGIEIPSKAQMRNGYFTFSFKVKNTTTDIKKFYYKILYQNTSYKFPDTLQSASENFYGSWINGLFTFKPTKILYPGDEITVTDSFRIVGNPRNEYLYFGPDPEKYLAIDDSIKAKIAFVKSVPAWLKSSIEDAKKLGISAEEKIYLNALWGIGYQKDHDHSVNNRWKRNPRMGIYEFMLVVTSPEDIGKIPKEVIDIQLKNQDGTFRNPFGYFLYREGKQLAHTEVIVSDQKLKVYTKFDLGAGIYIDKLAINKSNFSSAFYNPTCGNASELYTKAQFQQYFHNIDKDYTVYNVPEIRDVTGENFSRKEYEELRTKYENKGSRVKMFVNSTDCPCKTVKSDLKKNSLQLTVPAVEPGNYKKEHVGISSRIGFVYGKFRAKLKFPPMLSKDNVWNGLTHAFWLLFQGDDNSWNLRRECGGKIGYIPKGAPDNETSVNDSKKSYYYSEIDFEIVKESRYWPKTSYIHSKKAQFKTEDAFNSDNVMVSCTNWDMGCNEPKNFIFGAEDYVVDSVPYLFNRWNFYSKALTSKVPVKHSEIYDAPYYYFEIEWLPEKIVWKIGPEKDKLRVICAMDKDLSSIPNNQMMILFTQEWHNEEWWPTAPYKQNFIPFPKKDIIGEILEIEVE